MRGRDRWEQWLRAEIASLRSGQGVDTVTAWAVASMLATYADADGAGITVSTNTVREQLRIGKEKLHRTVDWLDETGVLIVVTKHGRGTPTRRALVIPVTGSSHVDGTTQASPVNPNDERTAQGSPFKTMLNGPVTTLNGLVTSSNGLVTRLTGLPVVPNQ